MKHLHELKLLLRRLRKDCRPIALAAVCFVMLGMLPAGVHADATTTPTNSVTAQITSLENQITQYQNTLNQLGSQKNTLQNAIDSISISVKKVAANISITQAKIVQANLELKSLGGAITDKQTQIVDDQQSIEKSLRTTYQLSDTTLVEQLLSSNGLIGAWDEATDLTELNSALQGDVTNLTNTKASLTEDYNSTQTQQSQLLALKKQLASQEAQLNQEKAQQTALLAQTKDSEATYQTLLSAAQAQLASFSTFAENAGGSGILGNETVCDSWGCYYNQRDSAWGNMSLNGTKYRLASDGCLITAMAMVMTHYGYKNVTPVTINSNPANFAAYYPAYLLFTINVDGVSATRVSTYLDATLASGNPVIVGLHAYGGTHFVVLVSGRLGSYIMKDPYVENGNNITFSSHYSLKDIYAIEKVVISS